MARVRIEEFGKGRIYPHEQTLSGPKADRLALTKACKMNLSPVFGLYPDPDGDENEDLDAAIVKGCHATRGDRPSGRGPPPVAGDERVGDQRGPRSDAGRLPVFIADGHHRYETANTYRNWLKEQGQHRGESDPSNFVLMMLVGMSDPGLAILPTHRLVSGFPNLSSGELATRISRPTWQSRRWEPAPEAARQTVGAHRAGGRARCVRLRHGGPTAAGSSPA